jgi:glycosyltransferase involved in cell wall biosynthesis
MRPTISILVPIYKSAPFIEKCTRSLFEQTFSDIEYVFVNDGTPDDSMSVLDKIIAEYPAKQKHVIIAHHEQNRGIAVTRNTLVALSTGEYLFFVDSDDFIEHNTVELLYHQAIQESADITLCDIYRDWKKGTKIQRLPFSSDPIQYTKQLIASETPAYCCAKLIKSDLYKLHHITCYEGVDYLEDYHVVTRLAYYANKIAKVNAPLYHYVQYNTSSATKSLNEKSFINILQSLSIVETFFKSQHDFEVFSQSIVSVKIRSKINLTVSATTTSLRKRIALLFPETTPLLAEYPLSWQEKMILKLALSEHFQLLNLFIILIRKPIEIKKKWFS